MLVVVTNWLLFCVVQDCKTVFLRRGRALKLRLRNIKNAADKSIMVGRMLLGFARGLCTLICRPSRNEMHVHEAKKYILQLHRNNICYL